jgi:hypothetical protein
MKSLNTLVVASVLALTGAGLASAQQIVHVTGSTAFRVADVTAEVDYLNASHAGSTAAYSGSSLTGANTSIIVASDNSFVFENTFNGSIAGDENVAAVGSQLGFPSFSSYTGSYTATVSGSSTAAASGGFSASSLPATDTAYADISFSDVSAATAQNIINEVTTSAYSFTDGGTVGVVPFVFVANATTDVTDFGSTSTFTSTTSSPFKYATTTVAANVTPQSFARLWSAGTINSAKKHPEIFTGNLSDSAYTIYALGRDIDSGTRATALAETGYPIKGNGAPAVTQNVVQYFPLDSSSAVVGNASNAAIASFTIVPTQTVDGISLTNGNGGYNSGGKLAEALSDTFSGLSKTVEITYLGVSDAYNALTNQAGATAGQPALLLSYNGVSFNPAGSSSTKGYAPSTDLTKIYYGAYTFWSYEHVLFNNNNSFDPTSLVSSLITQLKTDQVDQLSSAGVQLSSMLVSRTDDGLLVQ